MSDASFSGVVVPHSIGLESGPVHANHDRRRFLRFLAASPLLPAAYAAAAQRPTLKLSAADEAITLMDFEEAAHRALPPAHWGYMSSGVDDDATIAANRAGFTHFQLRPRRLVDVSRIDLKTTVFDAPWESPIFLCPVGGQKMFNAEGEVAVARAARAKKVVQILSTATSSAVEDVAAALGTPPWYQLYMPSQWDGTEHLVKRVEATGSPVLVWTIDLLGGRNLETAERFRRSDTAQCTACHATARGGRAINAMPMFSGITGGMNPPAASWAYVDRLKKLTRMKLVLKGIETREDARLAREHGVDGVIVSNHGGRSLESGRATIDELAEVLDGVGGQIPVLVDGGFRRGTDVFKALALGARAVGIGRPYIWGLSAFGQPGVERVIDILRAELQLTMRQCGTPSIRDITRGHVTTAS
jgi:isopentenyl diphosphate isomerase/L-lactate dehydrogenase-like FMN-dependent dehydrogenase